MSVGDLVLFERRNGDGEWEPYGQLRLLQANKTRSSEYVEASSENTRAHVTFRFRWHRQLAPIEFDTVCYRMRWRGQLFDIRGYDDYKYQHRTVDIQGVSYG